MTSTTRRAAFTMIAATFMSGIAVGVAGAQIAIIERPMPGLRVEVVPPVPHPGWSWVPGHWAWRDRWVWIRGHYINGAVPPMPVAVVEAPPPPPGPRFFWVKGHYVWEGGGWAWHPGHWVR